MGQVIANATVSLDGYVAKDDDTIGRLFDWFDAGDIETPTRTPDITFHLTPENSAHWHQWVGGLGALVCGRVLFDVTDGWGGHHTMGVPVVVVTHEVPTDWVEAHPDAELTFVTTGVADAVARAQELAGDATVAVAAGTIAGQCLQAGLLDAVSMDVVPVVMGGGKPYFGSVPTADILLGDPTSCVVADRVTHLVFPTIRS